MLFGRRDPFDDHFFTLFILVFVHKCLSCLILMAVEVDWPKSIPKKGLYFIVPAGYHQQNQYIKHFSLLFEAPAYCPSTLLVVEV